MIHLFGRQAFSSITLHSNQNQARLLGEYAIDFLKNGNPSKAALERTKLFHTDSVLCGLSALAHKTNAPTVLREEALSKTRRVPPSDCNGFAKVFGSKLYVPVEAAICANSAAVREWDSNGTVFGYNKDVPGHQAGEFGHNDYYPVAIAAAHQNQNINGEMALKAMLLSDEIRGRLAEVFSLKTYNIDHVVHGAIAAACTYGALMGANAQQIEYAIGMFVAHYIPFRAIRAGHQLSDSKGASAAISTEAAIKCIQRTMKGFVGPADIFRNPEAIFRLNQKTNGDSPFNLVLGMEEDDFAVMGMHFKLGLYEHQSAGALEGLQKLIYEAKFIQDSDVDTISKINVIAYQPAFGIIGDPAKRDPHTRQSADHSMVYILSTMLRKAFDNPNFAKECENFKDLNEVWKYLFLSPDDYSREAVNNPRTRQLMSKITFEHGGKSYDDKYPKGIPTTLDITLRDGTNLSSGLVMFPAGHANNKKAKLRDILNNKFHQLGSIAIPNTELLDSYIRRLQRINKLTNVQLKRIYDCDIDYKEKSIDE